MKIRIARETASIVTVLLALLLSQGAWAQERSDRQADKAAPTVDIVTGKALSEAIELLNTDKPDEARQVLGKLKLERLSPYERSRVEQMFASMDYKQENYASARTHMEAALASGGLNAQEESQANYQIAQMYMAEEKWAEGAAAMERWIASDPMANSAAYYLLAVAYYQQEKFDAALPPATKAVELSTKPLESWLQLLQALLLQKEAYKSAVAVLEQLVTLYPEKKTYWLQLASVYATLEDYPNALAIMQIAKQRSLLTEASEFRRLADMLMVADNPFGAAQVLSDVAERKLVEPDSKFYESLANAWIGAKEYAKARQPLEQAGALAHDGNLFERLGEVNVQLKNWDEAARAFKLAVDNGKLKDEGNTQLLLGIAYYNMKSMNEALPWFRKAATSPAHRAAANVYLQLITASHG